MKVMNWSAQTKLFATIGMLLANLMVIVGWYLLAKMDGDPIFLGVHLGIIDFAFFFCVFLWPATQRRKDKR